MASESGDDERSTIARGYDEIVTRRVSQSVQLAIKMCAPSALGHIHSVTGELCKATSAG